MRTLTALLIALSLTGCLAGGSDDPATPVPSARASLRPDVSPRAMAGLGDEWLALPDMHPVRPRSPVVPSPRLIVTTRSPQPASHRTRGGASYCAPTPRYCHGWGGDAHLAAVPSFRYGDKPYRITVRGPKGVTTVTVVSYGALPKGRIVDLSPAAFREACGPLSMGVCTVTAEGIL